MDNKFRDYLINILLESNKLSQQELKDIGIECLKWAGLSTRQPIKTKTGILSSALAFPKCKFEKYWEGLVSIINEHTKGKNDIKNWYVKDFDINPVKDLGLIFPFRDMEKLYHSCTCGALNMRFYKLLYYFDFLGIEIKDPKLKDFWNFYKKTLNVYAIAIQNYSWGCNIYIIPKFDEIYIEDNVAHYKYNNILYCDGVEVPRWLYNIKRKNMKISTFNNIENADYRTVFVKKAGIEKFIETGELIDTYENYPENEWWAKSEYKLIDMKDLIIQRIVKDSNGKVMGALHYDYAPYLCMKNQTTGEYHLEGVSPNCRDLYDALKMRYKGLDLPKYEIRDIK